MNARLETEFANLPRFLGSKYQCGALLAQTTLSILCKATCRESARLLNAKIFLDRPQAHAQWIALFEEEVRKLKASEHSQLISLIDGGVSDDWMYFILEQSSGRPLAEQLSNRMSPITEVRQMLADVGGALAVLHANGVVHGHVSPDTIFCEHGRYRLGGYCPESIEKVRRHISGNSDLIFCPLTIAPEQVTNASRGPATDIFALAALAYRMLAGAAPFRGSDAFTEAMRRLTARPLPLARIRTDIPAEFDAAILKALLRKVEDRFARVDEFLAACGVTLEKIQEAVSETEQTELDSPADNNSAEQIKPESGNILPFSSVSHLSLNVANKDSESVEEMPVKAPPKTEAASTPWSLNGDAETYKPVLSLQIEKEHIKGDSLFLGNWGARRSWSSVLGHRLLGAAILTLCLGVVVAYNLQPTANSVDSDSSTAARQSEVSALPASHEPAVPLNVPSTGKPEPYDMAKLHTDNMLEVTGLNSQVLVLDPKLAGNNQPKTPQDLKRGRLESGQGAATSPSAPTAPAAPAAEPAQSVDAQTASVAKVLPPVESAAARSVEPNTAVEISQTQQAKIDSLLKEALQFKESGRFVGPPGKNALERIKAVRAIDPNNELARDYSYEMAATNISMGDEARSRGDLGTMQAYFSAAVKFGVDRNWLYARSDRKALLERSRSSVVIMGKSEDGVEADPSAYLQPGELEERIKSVNSRYGYAQH